MNITDMDIPGLLTTPSGRLVISSLLGAVIGAEREWRRHREGMRSCALVAMAACAFAWLGVTHGGGNPGSAMGSIVQGVGFLGAGVIIHQGPQIGGLATAATFLAVAAVGALAGTGELVASLVVAVMTFAAHLILRPLSQRISRGAPAPESVPQ